VERDMGSYGKAMVDGEKTRCPWAVKNFPGDSSNVKRKSLKMKNELVGVGGQVSGRCSPTVPMRSFLTGNKKTLRVEWRRQNRKRGGNFTFPEYVFDNELSKKKNPDQTVVAMITLCLKANGGHI